jgi:hypothetical protein
VTKRGKSGKAMTTAQRVRSVARWTAAAAGLAAATYGMFVSAAWLRYGHVSSAGPDEKDDLLDRYMPVFEVAERHRIAVAAPAAITFAAAADMDLYRSLPVRTIFRARGRVMGASVEPLPSEGFLLQMQRIGWGVLADRPGQEIAMGAVTQPWLADVVFRPLPPEQFSRFDEPGYVKIAWTLRADPVSDSRSVFRTETRVVATDSSARMKFRRYWSFASPGIVLIRWLVLRPVKTEAEARARAVPH